MQQRIDRLESLVKSLMLQNQQPKPPEDCNNSNKHHDVENFDAETRNGGVEVTSPTSTGETVFDGSHSVYKASDNWSNVFREVSELKRFWNQSQDELSEKETQQTLSYYVDGSAFLSGRKDAVNKTDLSAALPPRSEVDSLIRQYFDHKNFAIPTAPVVYQQNFMQQYEEHWNNPSDTSVMWIGLLFSILAVTMLSYHLAGNEPPEYKGSSRVLYEQYRMRTAQCLMKGDIAKCLPYTLETLLLNTTAELARHDDNSRGLWMMTGVVIRAAINMGYHRDPSQIASISVMQAEYRRRIWLGIVGKDCIASFLAGFPSMMPRVYADTLEPRNLYDWELTPDTTELPESRPLTEWTPVTYLIAKGRLLNVLAGISDLNNELLSTDYDKVVELDDQLRETYQQLPPNMLGVVIDSESQSKAASELSAVQMKFLYHRAMCALHRRYVNRGRLEARFKLSRDRCVSSALELLAQQELFHRFALIPGSLFVWYNLSHARHDFILAGMILSLELDHQRRCPAVDGPPNFNVLKKALTRSCAIWNEVRNSSSDAKRTYQTLSDMLLTFEVVNSTPKPSSVGGSELYAQSGCLTEEKLPEPQNWEFSNDMDIDWAGWDSFIEGIDFEGAYEEGLGGP
ncbi:hypothetical protein GLAREA_05887 [Glarea lozoyensis ATCC 20868]|uniref:Xylanolytic transcriptional activator regulatory domain-containing protein n=1 Tax=Glarea lozoyensis (strain ATCC 20868 / MF5171) TaxID=1116229 RepID=S3D525_GLAL2|nr:uncharacterized protein GLAREA_05887 [Glarea lozoyensis ATCC 20868]EPE32875.1 hypothetical protein GLAREA_05887 [Glarea lozoyensis ATCC 20868]